MFALPDSRVFRRLPVIGCLAAVGAAAAQTLGLVAESIDTTPVPLEVETSAAILTSRILPGGAQAKELHAAVEIREGQMVYYTVRIKNPGQIAAHNVVVTKPVPANTRYVAESAAAPGATLTFSIDGGLTFAPVRQLVIKDERGTLRPAPSERYTHVRWQMRYPLAPGAVAYARFRAVFR